MNRQTLRTLERLAPPQVQTGITVGRWVAVAASPVAAFAILLMALFFGRGNTVPSRPAPPTCAADASVPASTDIDPATLERINALKADYATVGQAAGLPWPLLAAIDYRENGNDPERSALSGEVLGTTNPDSGVVTSSKQDSLERAAAHIKAMASSVYQVELGPESGGEDVRLALLAYNRGWIYARVGASPDVSPYVMNQYDGEHVDMTWPDIAGEPLAGLQEVGRYGGFTLFVRLGGSTAGACGTTSNVDVVRIAAEQVGKREIPAGCNCGPEIEQFLGESATSLSDEARAWCAMFVSWVYREAGQPFTGGHDGGWNLWGVTGVRTWLEANGEWQWNGDGEPREGDAIVFWNDEHVGLVERMEGKTVHTIEGNSGHAVTRRTYAEEGGAYSTQIDGWGRPRAAS